MKTTGLGYLFKRGKSGSKVKDSEPGIYYLQFTVNGSKKFMSLKTGNKVIAQKRRKKTLLPALFVDTSEKVILHVAEARKLLNNVKINLDDVWSKYENSAKRPQSSPGTLGNYKRMWKCFKDWLNAEYPDITSIDKITDKVAEEYSNFLWTKPITENTYNYHLQACNLVLKIVTGSLQTAFTGLSRKNGESINRLDFSPEQIKLIFATLDSKDFKIMNKPEMKLLCYIGTFTGLRLHDAVMLKTDSVDLKKNLISLTPAKTRNISRQVHIPIHPELRRQFNNIDKGDYVLPSISERYLRNPTGVKLDFMTILDKAGLTDSKKPSKGRRRRLYGFHSFRHSFCSIAANAGVPMSTLAGILGDNSRTLEKYYLKVNDKAKLDCINSLPSLIKLANPGVIDVELLSDAEVLSGRIQDACKLIIDNKMNANLKKQLLAILKC